MDEKRPKRRRELSPKERKALEKQRRKQEEIEKRTQRRDAKYREEARKKARRNGEPHIVVEIPPDSEKSRYNRAEDFSSSSDRRQHRRETETRRSVNGNRASKNSQGKTYEGYAGRKRGSRTIPDIIERETDKRVRNLEASDHKDGFYADEVEVRKAQARKQLDRRRKKMPKPISPKKRRIKRISAYVSIIAVVVIIGIVLSLTVLFKTEKIYVKGNEYYADDTIIRLSGVSEGQNIFMASMFGNSDAVSDNLPYVKSAKIKFQIPNTLVIDIENETAVYSIRTDGIYYKVSGDNRILEQVSSKPKKLASIIAPSLKSTEIGDKVEFSDKVYTKALEEINRCIKKNKYNKINEINIREISKISVTYDKRIKIKIGIPESVDYKLRTAFAIINEKLDPNHTEKIKGVLNVSNCDKTKKSYFKEGGIKDKDDEITSPTSSATEETTVRTTYVAPLDSDDSDNDEDNIDNEGYPEPDE